LTCGSHSLLGIANVVYVPFVLGCFYEAVALVDRGMIRGKTENFLEVVYTPLLMACEIPALKQPARLYVGFWRKLINGEE
jgi:hypothetical protein